MSDKLSSKVCKYWRLICNNYESDSNWCWSPAESAWCCLITPSTLDKATHRLAASPSNRKTWFVRAENIGVLKALIWGQMNNCMTIAKKLKYTPLSLKMPIIQTAWNKESRVLGWLKTLVKFVGRSQVFKRRLNPANPVCSRILIIIKCIWRSLIAMELTSNCLVYESHNRLLGLNYKIMAKSSKNLNKLLFKKAYKFIGANWIYTLKWLTIQQGICVNMYLILYKSVKFTIFILGK